MGCAEGGGRLLQKILLCHEAEACGEGGLGIHPEVAPSVSVMEESLDRIDLEEVAVGQLAACSQTVVVEIVKTRGGHFALLVQR